MKQSKSTWKLQNSAGQGKKHKQLGQMENK